MTQEKINNILSTKCQELIQAKEFYFQNGQDAVKKWNGLELSKEHEARLIDLCNDYDRLKEEQNSNSDLKEIIDLLFEITSYCDVHANEKKKYNRYSDNRTIAKAGVRMGNWMAGLARFKFESEQLQEGSIQNAFDYLLDPLSNTTILSENHRLLIANNLLKKDYSPSSFVEDLKEFFSHFKIELVNQANYTQVLSILVYELDNEWKEVVIGLMASDGTNWQDGLISQLEGYDACILWNSKRPSGTAKTLKFLRGKLIEDGSFPLFYSMGGEVRYKAEIIDYIENDDELKDKQWDKVYKVRSYSDKFSEYRNDNKKASIVFLARKVEKIQAIPVSKFEFYGNFDQPRQDNISPIKVMPSSVSVPIDSEHINHEQNTNKMNFPLNTILYGPPGTGKTYNTILRAAQIIENRVIDNYAEALEVFKKNLHDKIEFITFHQNYSYEDFIQGLRPDTENDDQLTFERKDGVFKMIADRALQNIKNSKRPKDLKRPFVEIFNEFISPLAEEEKEIEVKMKKLSYYITGVGSKSIEFRKSSGGTGHTLSIATLKKMYLAESVLDMQGLASYYSPLLEELLKLGKDTSGRKEKIKRSNYVIIIDEINRANISRVFGELITLIEPDKRSEGEIPLEARLPSGDSFMVPSNLYIIGTMNTADKSIALLDIALRRRFEFESMYPQYELAGQQIYNVEILKKINKQIIDSKGHDFQIGHAYFMGENNDLIHRMNKKVIPLLLEYYMNDEKEVKGILQSAGLQVEDGSWPLRIISKND